MFEFWRNWRKSAAEKRQEAINAYLDDTLSAAERQEFDRQMALDEALRREVDSLRQLRAQLRQLPSRPVPRNFMLNPERYGRPASQPLFQFYPVLRAATVLTGLFVIVAVGLGLFGSGGPLQSVAFAPQQEALVVEVTRIVTETVVVEGEAVAVTRVVETEGEAAPAPASEIQNYEAETGDVAEDVAEADVYAADEVTMPEAEAAAEMPAEEAAAPSAPEPTSAATTAAMASPAPTATAAATPTTSPLPRIEATALPERIAEQDGAVGAAAGDMAATAVPISSPTPTPSNWITVGFVALLALFVLLLGATLWVRRQV